MKYLCATCYDKINDFIPDMGDGIQWQNGECEQCNKIDVIVFSDY